jgi:hypothetical protein
MLIEGVAHLNAKIPTRDKLALGANAHIQMLLWKPNKVHFQFEEPEIDLEFEQGTIYKKTLMYHVKMRFEIINKYVEKYIVFIGNEPVTFT